MANIDRLDFLTNRYGISPLVVKEIEDVITTMVAEAEIRAKIDEHDHVLILEATPDHAEFHKRSKKRLKELRSQLRGNTKEGQSNG